jgi:hypothetical protein
MRLWAIPVKGALPPMPYADPERQRRAKRESYARIKANGKTPTVALEPELEPASASIITPAAVPSRADLDLAGMAINCPRMLYEDNAHYHERLRGKWKVIRRVLEG